jgi:hypothetical protein
MVKYTYMDAQPQRLAPANATEQRSMPLSESTKSEIVKRALIVGISEYSHKYWSLKYTCRNAEELYDFLLSDRVLENNNLHGVKSIKISLHREVLVSTNLQHSLIRQEILKLEKNHKWQKV